MFNSTPLPKFCCALTVFSVSIYLNDKQAILPTANNFQKALYYALFTIKLYHKSIPSDKLQSLWIRRTFNIHLWSRANKIQDHTAVKLLFPFINFLFSNFVNFQVNTIFFGFLFILRIFSKNIDCSVFAQEIKTNDQNYWQFEFWLNNYFFSRKTQIKPNSIRIVMNFNYYKKRLHDVERERFAIIKMKM